MYSIRLASDSDLLHEMRGFLCLDFQDPAFWDLKLYSLWNDYQNFSYQAFR
jgi:hypothetical protein